MIRLCGNGPEAAGSRAGPNPDILVTPGRMPFRISMGT